MADVNDAGETSYSSWVGSKPQKERVISFKDADFTAEIEYVHRSRQICRNFERGVCARGDKCQFAHPESVKDTMAGEGRNVWGKPVCLGWQKGYCHMKRQCKFPHNGPSPDPTFFGNIEESLKSKGPMSASLLGSEGFADAWMSKDGLKKREEDKKKAEEEKEKEKTKKKVRGPDGKWYTAADGDKKDEKKREATPEPEPILCTATEEEQKIGEGFLDMIAKKKRRKIETDLENPTPADAGQDGEKSGKEGQGVPLEFGVAAGEKQNKRGNNGCVVAEVRGGGAAAAAGVLVGDRLAYINGSTINSMAELVLRCSKAQMEAPGQSILFMFNHAGGGMLTKALPVEFRPGVGFFLLPNAWEGEQAKREDGKDPYAPAAVGGPAGDVDTDDEASC